MAEIEPIRWQDDHLVLLDQTALPHKQILVHIRTWKQAADAIRVMKVRGAPAIGVTAVYAMALASRQVRVRSMPAFLEQLTAIGKELANARPTAVNLRWGVERSLRTARQCATPDEACERLLVDAKLAHEEDIRTNRAMGKHGAALIQDGSGVLTHCNTGALATAGFGTALGVIRAAWEEGKRFKVFCDETRPWLQGARLTAWELVHLGIPASLIADSAAGSIMRRGEIQTVIVGADRIAANGDTANKIGTYSLSVLAKENGANFYIAAPMSTVDFSIASGDSIPIEERASKEVTHFAGKRIAPEGIGVRNPAFDVTPGQYITGIITEHGVAKAPFEKDLQAMSEHRTSETVG